MQSYIHFSIYERKTIHFLLSIGVKVSSISKMLGAYDKTVMHLGEDRMRQEFERLLPVMKQGGFIPGCDHQTPPQVSFEDYKLYMKLLKEYAEKACE